MNAALLAQKKPARLWNQLGLEMNLHDPCVFNGMVKGSQFTVTFHVDDLMMSHKSPVVVTEMINRLDQECGSKDKLTMTRGKAHECPGMTVDFAMTGEVSFSQCDHTKKPLNSLPTR